MQAAHETSSCLRRRGSADAAHRYVSASCSQRSGSSACEIQQGVLHSGRDLYLACGLTLSDVCRRVQRRPLRTDRVVTHAAKKAAPKGTPAPRADSISQQTALVLRMQSTGTQKLGTQNFGTQLSNVLGTIRLSLGTQQGKQAYKPGKKDPNVVRHPTTCGSFGVFKYGTKAHTVSWPCKQLMQ